MAPNPTNDPGTAAVSPSAWPWARQSPPYVSSEATGWAGAVLRCWSGTSAEMEQPPLDHHYVVMHQGGAKRVTRRRDGPTVSATVDEGSLTLVPAGTAYRWQTQGPIAFTHLYLKPERLASFATRELDADASAAQVVDRIGCRDSVLEPLLARMVAEVRAGPSASTLLLDSLLESFLARLAHRHLAGTPARSCAVLALAPHRLRRVLEFVEARLGDDIVLADLAAAAGSSQSHFGRAFRLATGVSPYRYVLDRRVEYAKVLLLTGAHTLQGVSAACGFLRQQQFAVVFKQRVGVGPKRFRMLHRS